MQQDLPEESQVNTPPPASPQPDSFAPLWLLWVIGAFLIGIALGSFASRGNPGVLVGILAIGIVSVIFGTPILGPILVAFRQKNAPVLVRAAIASSGVFTAVYLCWAYEEMGRQSGSDSFGQLGLLLLVPHTYIFMVFAATVLSNSAWLIAERKQGLFSPALRKRIFVLSLCVLLAVIFGRPLLLLEQ